MIAEVITRTRGRSIIPFTQCAWCGSINLHGHYFRLPHVRKIVKQVSFSIPFVVRVDVNISHGICPSCADDLSTRGRGR